MNKERALIVLVVLDVILAFSVIGAELMFGWLLPDTLRDYATSGMTLPTSPWEFFLFVLWAATIACTLAAWIALVNFWWFARRLYVTAWAIWTLLVLLSGPSVLNPVGAMFDTAGSVVGGLILGLVYFSDLSRHFERRAADMSAGAPVTA